MLGPYWPLWPPEAIGLQGHAPPAAPRPAGPARQAVVASCSSGALRRSSISTPAALERLRRGRPGQRFESCPTESTWTPSAPDPAARETSRTAPSSSSRAGAVEGRSSPSSTPLSWSPTARRPTTRRRRRRLAGLEPCAGAWTLRRRRPDRSARPGSREDVPSRLRECALYCLPSVREPFGISALEAMACGRPVLATDAGGLSHLVGEGGGRLVRPSDAPGAGAGHARALGRPGPTGGDRRENALRVRRRYSWQRVVEDLEAAYREAVAIAASRR